MTVRIFIRLFFNTLLGLCFSWLLLNAELCTYLAKVSYGQLNLIFHTEKIKDVLNDTTLSAHEKQKLLWVDEIKKYSVDSLGYKPTNNFTTFFNQHNQSVLWIVTACKPFSFEAYQWNFPVVGTVEYKGYFNKHTAWQEYVNLLRKGYDTELSPVSAWSTLGWLPDPVLSSMLTKSKAGMANLLFHELFHATYYAPGTVDVNENLADFVAHKATLQFLKNDTAALNKYLKNTYDDSLYNQFIFKGYETLNTFYHSSTKMDRIARVKQKKKLLFAIYFESLSLKLNYPKRYEHVNEEILLTKNAFFMQAKRYDGLYDSLNKVLNTQYNGNLKKMIVNLRK